MAANETRVVARVTEILNLCEPRTFSPTISPRIKTRNAEAISTFVTEAGLMLLKTIAETPGNEYRVGLVNQVTLTNGQMLPEHQGTPVYVEIQPYPSADYIQGMRRDYRKIESYRLNPSNVYDSKNHNVAGSTLSGFYDIWEKKFFFTGNAARVGLAQVVRADVTTKIPEVFENTWIKLSIGQAAKSGSGAYDLNLINKYGQEAMMDLQEFKTGKRQFPEVSDPEPTSAVHV